MQRKDYYVYLHRFSNGTLYVGKGVRKRAWSFSHGRHNRYWDRLNGKYGNPVVRILSDSMSNSDALAFESLVIARMKAKGKSLCNLTDGGDGCRGFIPGPETRAKLSAINSGENNCMFGKSHSESAKNRVSIANSGKYIGEKSVLYNSESKQFIHESGSIFTGTRWEMWKRYGGCRSAYSMLFTGKIKSYKGWRLSKTDKSKTGKAFGKRHGRYDSRRFRFENRDGSVEVCTKFELCQKYGLKHSSNVSSLCNGKIKSYKGWTVSV